MKQSDVLSLPDGRHLVESGLYLQVQANGARRSWLFVIKKAGKRRAFGLGSARILPLSKARKKAETLRGLFASGVDPLTYSNKTVAEKPAHQATKKHPFREVALEAMENRSEVRGWRNGSTTRFSWSHSLANHVFPVVGDMDIEDVSYTDVLNILKPIWTTKPTSASYIRTRLELIIAYAIRKGYRQNRVNPALWKNNLEYDLPSMTSFHETKHRAALAFDQIKQTAGRLWRDGSTGSLCVLFGILTATRSHEFREAAWAEMDLQDGVWTIPPERRKDKKLMGFRIPLSKQARLILERMPKKGALIFLQENGRTLLPRTAMKALRLASEDQVGTLHGCRSTFRDWCAETGKDPVLAEKSLMHATGNEVERAYQRSDLLERRRELMQQWADAVLPGGRKPRTGRKGSPA